MPSIRTVVSLALVVAGSRVATAQAARSLEGVAVHDHVRLRARSVRWTIDGRVTMVSDDSIVVQPDVGRAVRLPVPAITTLERATHSHSAGARRGVAVGAAIGVGSVLASLALADRSPDQNRLAGPVIAVGFYTALGAAAGWIAGRDLWTRIIPAESPAASPSP